MKTPFESFLGRSLKGFEEYLRSAGLEAGSRRHRMRGAEQFALYLLGRSVQKGQWSKGKVSP